MISSSYGKIPRALLSMDKFIADIKLPLNNKMLQMEQNFIEKTSGNTTKFFSDRIVHCQLGQTVAIGQTILKVTKQQVTNSKLKKDIISYYGCSGQESFKEITTGYFSGKTSYELLGPNNISIFKSVREENSGRVLSLFFLNDQLIYKVIERKKTKYDEVLYKKYPFTLNMNYNGGNINFSSNEVFNGAYRLKIFSNKRIEYLDDSSKLTSLVNFQRRIGFRGVNYFVDLALMDLPKTKFISSGSGNTKMLEELRNAQTFLISGSNIEYVKNLINKYIKEAGEGNIIDNRR
jgi:hypothetical protein